MKIGYNNPNYNVRRMILDKTAAVDYVRCRSFNGLLSKSFGQFGIDAPWLGRYGTLYLGGIGRCDCYHFFNSLAAPWLRVPYITTYEDELPRFLGEGRPFKLGVASMRSDRCRALLALSDCARHRMNVFSKRNGFSDVMEKVEVLLPPQQRLTTETEISRKRQSGSIRFFFVGADFFRKGGGETLRAMARVRQDCEVELYVVGDVGRSTYTMDPTVDNVEETMKLIDDNRSWVHFCQRLPNEEVLALMKSCDVGLLPTRDDTFGYSVLEMQACGLPVITTNVWALPEINNQNVGWMVPVPLDAGRRADFSTSEDTQRLSSTIEAGVYSALCDIVRDRAQVLEKGLKAFRRVCEFHDPLIYGNRLNELYQKVL